MKLFEKAKDNDHAREYLQLFYERNSEDRDIIGALDYLKDILENAPYDEIMPHVLRLKTKYLSMTTRYDEVHKVLKQVFTLITRRIQILKNLPEINDLKLKSKDDLPAAGRQLPPGGGFCFIKVDNYT